MTNLLARYEEVVTLHLTNQVRLQHCLNAQGQVILALDDSNQMWVTKSYGFCVIASREKSCWPAVS